MLRHREIFLKIRFLFSVFIHFCIISFLSLCFSFLFSSSHVFFFVLLSLPTYLSFVGSLPPPPPSATFPAFIFLHQPRPSIKTIQTPFSVCRFFVSGKQSNTVSFDLGCTWWNKKKRDEGHMVKNLPRLWKEKRRLYMAHTSLNLTNICAHLDLFWSLMAAVWMAQSEYVLSSFSTLFWYQWRELCCGRKCEYFVQEAVMDFLIIIHMHRKLWSEICELKP